MFAALAAHDAESHAALADLIASGETVGLVESSPPPLPAGFRLSSAATCVQMVQARPGSRSQLAPVSLGDADAEEMLALAELTRPGPFRRHTHRFGGFVGIRESGRLIAMAGTRLAPAGYREVSGVCTHPDARGRGLAAGLITAVADAIRAGGDIPFLTSYADNQGAIALYERLGFAIRRQLTFTLIDRL